MTTRLAFAGAALLGALIPASRARAQLDQPLPPPPEKTEPAPAPKLTKAPALKKPVEPSYPPDAFAAGISGDVTLMLNLDAEGHVTAVTVTKPAGNGFDEAAAAPAVAGRGARSAPREGLTRAARGRGRRRHPAWRRPGRRRSACRGGRHQRRRRPVRSARRRHRPDTRRRLRH